MSWLPFELDPATSRTPVAEKMRVQQALDLTKQLPITLAGNLSLSALMALALWGAAPPSYMLGWLALFWITAIPGLHHWMKYRNAPVPARVTVKTAWRASIFSLIVAAPWAIGNWFFFHPGPNIDELLPIFVTGGLTAGVVSILATVPTVCLAFIAATATPLILKLFGEGEIGSAVMASMLLIYIGCLSSFIRNSYRRMRREVEAEIEKQAIQKNLREAHRRLSQAMERVSDEILLFDNNECLVLSNVKGIQSPLFPNMEMREGTSLASLIGQSLKTGLVPAAKQREQAWVEEFLAWYRKPDKDFIVETEDARVCGLSVQPSADGDKFLVLADITRLQAETAKAKQSEQRLKDFAEAAADWMWELDAMGRFSMIAPHRPSEVPVMHLLGESISAIGSMMPNKQTWQALEGGIAAKMPFRDFRFRIVSGENIWNLSASGKPIYDERGEFLGHRGTFRDVTDEVLASIQLREAKERAEQSSRSKSDFLAHMSHELRTPLNAILGFSEMMALGVYGKIQQPQYLDYIDTIHSSGVNLLALINDILEISRIETGKGELKEQSLDIIALFKDCLRSVEGRATEAHHIIDMQAPSNLPALWADKRYIKQILMNLLNNAIRFTPPGGCITLGARLTEQKTICLWVTDNGPGISKADQAGVLVPFERGSALTRTETQGSGLGLPLSRMLSELYGGQLSLVSDVGKGLTVNIEFPSDRTIEQKHYVSG